jgi:hypothetical protein
MQSKTLSNQAIKVIKNYLRLPFKDREVSCPYYNNKRSKVRGGLRVLVGKGTVEDIVEEAKIISLREKIDLEKLNNEELKKFLVDNNIGIDCSAFAYYVLDAELRAQNKGKLVKHLQFPAVKNPLRKLLTKLRPVENTNVQTLAHEKNSQEIKLENIKPGDMIIMLDAGTGPERDHLLVVHQVDFSSSSPLQGEVSAESADGGVETPHIIHYTHSLNWSTDGKYNHGVRQGKIEITDIKKPLTEQRWVENDKTGEENETFARARRAKQLSVKRLNTLSS